MKLRDYVQVNYDERKIVVFYRDGIRLENNERNLKFINELIHGIDDDKIESEYSDYKRIIELLEKHRFVTSYNENEEMNAPEQKLLWYLDQFNENPNILLNKLNHAKVCIVGVGGIGGNILQMLLSSGIKNYILIDFDVVEYHNLNRQYMYSIKDIGKIKTEVCKEKITEFDSSINCKAYNLKIGCKEDLTNLLKNDDIDIIVSAADTPYNIGAIIKEIAKEKKCAFSAGSLGIDLGQYIFASSDQLENYIEGKPLDGMKGIDRKVIRGSFGPTNEIICSYMAMDIVYYIIGHKTWSDGKTIFFDFLEKKVFSISN